MDPVVLIALVVAAVVLGAVAFVLVRRARAVEAPPPVEPGEITPAVAEVAEVVEKPPAAPEGLRGRLGKTRQAISGRLAGVLRRGDLDAEFWTDLEDTLVASDMGVKAATSVVERVRKVGPADAAAVRSELQRQLGGLLEGRSRTLERTTKPAVVLVVGVNGTGKTTSIAKLAHHLQGEGTSVLLGAADTFRAAAGDQLKTWGSRVGVDVVGGQSGADPAAVAYDAYHAAKARGVDVVIVDTAGRLHSKTNLMGELDKVARVLRREAGGIDEVLLVLDGTTGQNAVDQARTFTEAVGVTGIVITKLDGTARGGVVVAIEEELGIPVKLIGVGEGLDDLVPFVPSEFVDALLGS